MYAHRVSARLRRAKRGRYKIRASGRLRLCVHRTARNFYAQIIKSGDPLLNTADTVIVSASTLDKDIDLSGIHGGSIAAAIKVGEILAQRAKDSGVKTLALDRAGYAYHGRVKAFAEIMRANELDF